jgi:hypothetical protein
VVSWSSNATQELATATNTTARAEALARGLRLSGKDVGQASGGSDVVDYLIKSLPGLVVIAAGLAVMLVVALALLGSEEPGKPEDYRSGRCMIVLGIFFFGGGLLFTLRLTCPWLPWHWIRVPRAGAGSIATWQAVVQTVALYAMGAHSIMLGFRARRLARSAD